MRNMDIRAAASLLPQNIALKFKAIFSKVSKADSHSAKTKKRKHRTSSKAISFHCTSFKAIAHEINYVKLHHSLLLSPRMIPSVPPRQQPTCTSKSETLNPTSKCRRDRKTLSVFNNFALSIFRTTERMSYCHGFSPAISGMSSAVPSPAHYSRHWSSLGLRAKCKFRHDSELLRKSFFSSELLSQCTSVLSSSPCSDERLKAAGKSENNIVDFSTHLPLYFRKWTRLRRQPFWRALKQQSIPTSMVMKTHLSTSRMKTNINQYTNIEINELKKNLKAPVSHYADLPYRKHQICSLTRSADTTTLWNNPPHYHRPTQSNPIKVFMALWSPLSSSLILYLTLFLSSFKLNLHTIAHAIIEEQTLWRLSRNRFNTTTTLSAGLLNVLNILRVLRLKNSRSKQMQFKYKNSSLHTSAHKIDANPPIIKGDSGTISGYG